MSNFKSGSGNLDFGSGDEDAEREGRSAESPPGPRDEQEQSRPNTGTATAETESSAVDSEADTPEPDGTQADETETDSSPEYPYFVRRNNVGDERDTRLEIHVRDKVADEESAFRNELAEQLDASEISKTDAREFALIAAFEHPDRVAELMRAEGFGALD